MCSLYDFSLLLVCKFIMPELYVLSGGHLLSVSHPISCFAASFGTTVPFWARNSFIDLLMLERRTELENECFYLSREFFTNMQWGEMFSKEFEHSDTLRPWDTKPQEAWRCTVLNWIRNNWNSQIYTTLRIVTNFSWHPIHPIWNSLFQICHKI